MPQWPQDSRVLCGLAAAYRSLSGFRILGELRFGRNTQKSQRQIEVKKGNGFSRRLMDALTHYCISWP